MTDLVLPNADLAASPDRPRTRLRGRVGTLAFLYLVALALAEAATRRLDPGLGLGAHAALLIALLAAAACHVFARVVPDERPLPAPDAALGLLVALSLPPLVRVVSLALPPGDASPPARTAAVGATLVVAGFAAMRGAGYRPRDVGLRPRLAGLALPLTLLTATSGVLLGYAEHRLLAPTPLVEEAPVGPRAWLALALPLGFAAFGQEFVLRGVVLRAAGDLLGPFPGLLFAAAVATALVPAAEEPATLLLAFAVAVAFGGAVRLSGSLYGVALAHGAASVASLLVLPWVVAAG